MSHSHGRFSYNNAPLPLKISLPFILMFFCAWLVGGTFLGQYFSHQLERDQRQKASALTGLVKREIDKELYNLRRSARLLSGDESIIKGTAEDNQNVLQQEIIPKKSVLDTDFILVVDRDRDTLIDLRKLPFRGVDIHTKIALDLVLEGSDISGVVGAEGGKAPVMLGTAPLKDENGVVGGLILGIALRDELLLQINESIGEEIIVLDDRKVVASTFSSELSDAELSNFEWEDETLSAEAIKLQGNSYLPEAILLKGIENEQLEIVLLTSQAPLIQAQRSLWLLLVALSSVGICLTAIIGYWIAKRVARPIQNITSIALKVVEENNFDLQAPVNTQDEIGALSTSLNQLIAWVGQYTDELEHAAQTLEANVDERTQDLSVALAELKETQSQLIQTEKMSSLGQMVAGIAHEINNPISFIQGNIKPLTEYFKDLISLLETYQKEYPNPTEAVLDKQEEVEVEFLLEDSNKILDSMKMGTQRVRDIVVSLRNFSRLDEASIKDVDLCEGLDSTLLILNHRIKQGVKVTKSYDKLPLVKCSPAQLNQVFTNIIANALDAMDEANSQPKQLEIATRTLSDGFVQVSIRDSGPGMPASVKAKIFDPFFTTKAVGKGTGLGLGICFKIVEQHQGKIEVNTEVGQGTEFVITLPTSADFGELEEPPASLPESDLPESNLKDAA